MNDSQLTFGAFKLNWNLRQLLREEESVAVEPKALELIRYLLLHRDRAVSKDELAEALWSDRVISDTVISQTVRKARAAVDDDGERQEVIQTVRGFGYRFVAQVKVIEDASSFTTEPAATQSASRRRMQAASWTGAVLVVLGLSAVWLWPSSILAPQTRTIAIAPTLLADNLPTAPDWLELGLPRLLGYALAGIPGLMVLGDAVAGVPDGEPEIDWIRDALHAEEIVQPIAMFEDGQWQLSAEIMNRDGSSLDLLTFRDEQLAVALSRLSHALSARYRPVGTRVSDHPLSEDPWVNESLARTIQALESGAPALAMETAALIIAYEPEHAWARYFHAVARRQTGDNRLALEELEGLLGDAALEEMHALATEVNNSIGVVAHQLGDVEKALTHFEAAAVLAEQLNNPRHLAQALVSQGAMLSALDRTQEADQRYEESMRLFTRIGYQPGRALVANSLGARAWRAGDVELSAHWHREALDIRRRYGRRSEVAQSLLNLSTTSSARMQFDDTRRLIEEALLLTEAQGLADMNTWAQVQLGHLQVRTGELARARLSLERGLAAAEKIGYAQARASALGGLGRLAARERDHQRGRELLMETLAAFEEMPHVRTRVLDARLDLAELALNHTNLAEAERWLNELESEFSAGDGPDPQSATWFHLQGRLAVGRDNPSQALAFLEQGLSHARRVNQLEPRVALIGELVEVALSLDDLDRAKSALAEVPAELHSHWRTLVMRAELSQYDSDLAETLELLERARKKARDLWTPQLQNRLDDRRRGIAGPGSPRRF